jgi:hypothetical protein
MLDVTDDRAVDVAVSLLYSTFRHRFNFRVTYNKFAQAVLGTDRGSGNWKLYLSDVLQYIVEEFSNGVVINVDQAECLDGETWPGVIATMTKLTLKEKFLFCVSGRHDEDMRAALEQSGMNFVSIVLPSLRMEHIVEIIEVLFARNVDDIVNNPFASHLLWLTGGIPRYFEYLMYAAACSCPAFEVGPDRMRNINLPKLFEYLAALDAKSAFVVFKRMKFECQPHVTALTMPSRIACFSMFSLSMNRVPVERTTVLGSLEDRDIYRVYDALEELLIDLDADSCVVIPPILLHYLGSGNFLREWGFSPTKWIMKGLGMTLDDSGNGAAMFVAVLLHRMWALRLLGTVECSLKDLLNIDIAEECNITVTLPEVTRIISDVVMITINARNVHAQIGSCHLGRESSTLADLDILTHLSG